MVCLVEGRGGERGVGVGVIVVEVLRATGSCDMHT